MGLFLQLEEEGVGQKGSVGFPGPEILGSWGLSNFAGSPALQSPGKERGGREGEVSQVSAVFLQDRSFRESLASTFVPPFDEINYEHCPGSFDSGDTCQDKIFQKHLYLII